MAFIKANSQTRNLELMMNGYSYWISHSNRPLSNHIFSIFSPSHEACLVHMTCFSSKFQRITIQRTMGNNGCNRSWRFCAFCTPCNFIYTSRNFICITCNFRTKFYELHTYCENQGTRHDLDHIIFCNQILAMNCVERSF